MSEKVKLPREIADALSKSKHIGPAAILGHLTQLLIASDQNTTPELFIICRYFEKNPYIMASAIISGYEVEETPEEKVKALFKKYNNETDMHYGYRLAVRECLEALNIEIDGVNT